MTDYETIYVARYTGTEEIARKTYLIEADQIGKAHRAARKLFGEGKSFAVREATPAEVETAKEKDIDIFKAINE